MKIDFLEDFYLCIKFFKDVWLIWGIVKLVKYDMSKD